MKKSLLAFTMAAALAGSAATYAFAQQPPATPAKSSAEDQWKPSPADRAAFVAARVAMLHARLALTPDQEKLWPPVESVLKDIAQKREARMEDIRAEREKNKGERPDAMTRLRRGADFMTQTGADLKRLADAAQPLYDKLDDSQKRRLEKIVHHDIRMRMREGFRERAAHRFAEMREHFDHWRNGDDNGPHAQGPNRDRGNGDYDDNNDEPNSGEQL